MPSRRPEPQVAPLQSIDPTALATVSGGAARASSGGDNSEVMTALTGVLESLNSLAGQQKQSGFGPNEMMMFMMMLGGGGGGAPVVQQAQPGTIGGYGGYTIDGVYYPFK
jgi:hypothetical protein